MWMWIKEIFLGFIGLASGFAVAAGIFAFVVTLGVVPRFAGRTHTVNRVLSYETAIFWGGMFGTLMSIFHLELPLPGWMGRGLLGAFGLSAGIYTGCLAVALAEIINTFPIMFRRIRMKVGQEWVLIAMALGKMAGAFYFYANHMTQ